MFPLEEVKYGGFSFSKYGGVLFLTAYIIFKIRSRERFLEIPSSIILTLSLFIAFTMFSLQLSYNLDYSAIGFIRLLIMAGFAIATADILSRTRDFKGVALSWFIPAIFWAALGVFQSKTGNTIASLGFDPNWETFIEIEDSLRASGPFSHPNYFALYLLVAFASGIYLSVFLKTKLKYIILLGLIVILAGIYYSMARSVFYGMAVFLVLWLYRKIWPLLLIGVIIGYTIIMTLDIDEAYSGEKPRGYSRVSRKAALISGFNMIKSNPIRGVGWLSFKDYYLKYSSAKSRLLRWGTIMGHNMFLETASESGIPALLSLIVLLGLIFHYSGKASFENWLWASLLAGILVFGLFNPLILKKTFWIPMALAIRSGLKKENNTYAFC